MFKQKHQQFEKIKLYLKRLILFLIFDNKETRDDINYF